MGSCARWKSATEIWKDAENECIKAFQNIH